jgi:hypothetical protein
MEEIRKEHKKKELARITAEMEKDRIEQERLDKLEEERLKKEEEERNKNQPQDAKNAQNKKQ